MPIWCFEIGSNMRGPVVHHRDEIAIIVMALRRNDITYRCSGHNAMVPLSPKWRNKSSQNAELVRQASALSFATLRVHRLVV
jgi:hypothetical protein